MQITLTNWSKREFKTLATPISWPFFSTGGKHLGFGIYGIPMYTTFLDKEVNTMVSSHTNYEHGGFVDSPGKNRR